MGNVVPFPVTSAKSKPDYVLALEHRLKDIKTQKMILDDAERLCGDKSALSVIQRKLRILEREMKKTKVMLEMDGRDRK